VVAPSWLANGLAIAMLSVAAYCASRLVVARLTHRSTHYSVDAVHTAMGVGMADMLTSHLASTPLWIALFAVAAGWFGVRAIGGLTGVRSGSVAVSSHLRHLVTSGAMVYMLVAAPTAAVASPPAAMSMARTTAVGAGGSARFPTLALLLGVFMVGYTVMVLDRMSRSKSATDRADGEGEGDGEGDSAILAPRTVACCQVAMNITMGYMLVTLL
jgi:Domain of unknown function (DUF5134)